MKIIFGDIMLIPWKIEDAPYLANIANNRHITDNLRDGLPDPYTEEDAVQWLNSIIPGNNPPRFFSICIDDKIAGSIGLVTKDNVYRKNIEIGYFLSEDHWGKGIMPRAIIAATTWAFSAFNVIRAYAEVYAENHQSRRALEKAGYSCEANIRKNVIKNDRLLDSCIYSVLKENFVPGGIIIRE